MILTFDKLLDCGEGHSPQCVHDPDGTLRVIYLKTDGFVYCREATPTLGIYDDLAYEEIGRISPDTEVSLPSLKKVAHHGAFGFWSSAGDHKFVIYMMPTDISNALIDGATSFSANSEVASLSATFINIHGELLNRYRALVTPGTKLEFYFSIGGSDETPLGVFYVDRASISYPECDLSVSGRNAIGKLLKEQTFDENATVDEGSLHDNVAAILEYAGIEDYFVGDATTGDALLFDPDTTLQEGINYAITLANNWKLGETLDGVVGVAPKSDVRFDPPSVYTFERDHNCWSYSIEFDDSDAASRICVYSEGESESDPVVRAYVNVTFNKWWAQPPHRTTYVKTVNGATLAQVTQLANTLAEAMATSGRIETFAGIFTPHLVIGDEVRIVDENNNTETIGAVTDVKQNFGQGGFYTSFSADSGGRKGRTTLKELIDTVASYPDVFTGHRSTEPVTEVLFKNKMAIEASSATTITGTISMSGGTLAIAMVVTRSAIGDAPDGWTLLHTSTGFTDSSTTQYVSIFYAFTTAGSLTATFTQASAGRMYVNFATFSGAGTPYIATSDTVVSQNTISVEKTTSDKVLWGFHCVLWSGTDTWTVTGVGEGNVIQRDTAGRLLSVFDSTQQKTITAAESNGSTNKTEYLAVGIPAAE